MNEKPIFVIGEQHAGRDIFNIARDLNVNQNSPAEDILKLIEAIQQKIGELEIAEKDKRRIVNQIEGAKIELEDEKPDKKLIAESITKTNEILNEAKTTGETLKDIGVLVAKAAAWLGTTAAKLGWMFLAGWKIQWGKKEKSLKSENKTLKETFIMWLETLLSNSLLRRSHLLSLFHPASTTKLRPNQTLLAGKGCLKPSPDGTRIQKYGLEHSLAGAA